MCIYDEKVLISGIGLYRAISGGVPAYGVASRWGTYRTKVIYRLTGDDKKLPLHL